MAAPHDPRPAPTVEQLALLDDPRLTAIGLLIETTAGLLDIFTEELEVHGLTRNAFEVLIRLARSPGRRLRMNDLAAQSTLTSSGLTRLIDRLVATGEVVREPSPSDRRGTYARITDIGLTTLVAALPEHLASIDRNLIAVLDPAELDLLLGLLRRLRAVVKPGSDPEAGVAGT